MAKTRKPRHKQKTASKLAAAKATAYHEAGHAVACFMMNVKMKSATIIPDKESDTAGHVDHENMFRGLNPEVELTGRARLQIERSIIICLAGFAAQRRYNKRSWRNYHGQSDFTYAVNLASYVDGDAKGASQFLKWVQFRAERLVERHWTEVRRVAQALLKHKVMNGNVIRREILGPNHFSDKRLKQMRAKQEQQQRELREKLTTLLEPSLAAIEHAMGLETEDPKLRARLISAAARVVEKRVMNSHFAVSRGSNHE
jgi:hypothetical protein